MKQSRSRSSPGGQGGLAPLSRAWTLVSFLLIVRHILGCFPHVHGESWGTALGLPWHHPALGKDNRAEVEDN